MHRLRLADEIADTIRELISRRELNPGSHLTQEDLAAQLGVSRTPLREALQRLAQEGLLVEAGGRGVEVRSVDVADLLFQYEVREVIDGLAARLAADRATNQELRALSEVLDTMERAVTRWDPHRWLLANLRFHQEVLTAARNPELTRLLGIVLASAKAFYPTVLLNRNRAGDALREHRLMLEAIAARSPDRAEALGRQHIASARALLLSASPTANPGGGGARGAKR